MTSSLSSGSRRRGRFTIPRPVRELLAMPPMPSRRRSAAIAALCTAAPVLVGQAAQDPALGLVACTGALAALYSGRG